MKEIAWWTLAMLTSAALASGVALYGEIIARIQWSSDGRFDFLQAVQFALSILAAMKMWSSLPVALARLTARIDHKDAAAVHGDDGNIGDAITVTPLKDRAAVIVLD